MRKAIVQEYIKISTKISLASSTFLKISFLASVFFVYTLAWAGDTQYYNENN